MAGHFVLIGHRKFLASVRHKIKHLLVINGEKSLTGNQNIRQSIEGLRDILSGRPEIIFARTGTDRK